MQLEFGVIGLGRMGGGLAYQALKKGMRVVGRDVAPATEELCDLGLVESKSLEDLVAKLSPPPSKHVSTSPETKALRS